MTKTDSVRRVLRQSKERSTPAHDFLVGHPFQPQPHRPRNPVAKTQGGQVFVFERLHHLVIATLMEGHRQIHGTARGRGRLEFRSHWRLWP